MPAGSQSITAVRHLLVVLGLRYSSSGRVSSESYTSFAFCPNASFHRDLALGYNLIATSTSVTEVDVAIRLYQPSGSS